MRYFSARFLVIALSFAAPALAADPERDPAAQAIDKATALVEQHQAAEALILLDKTLASMEPSIAAAAAKGHVYCATSTEEMLLYTAMVAKKGEASTVLGSAVCQALFLRAYALTELKREPEAVATLEKLTAMAPLRGQYFVELGYAYRVTGAPDKAMTAYRHAADASDAQGDDGKRARAAGLRGIGYLLIDKNDLDGAADAYRKSLVDDPDSQIAKSELQYIADQRKKSG